MTENWNEFLKSQDAYISPAEDITFPRIQNRSGKTIYSIPKLAVLPVGGKDAATFLQGQATCNIHEITKYRGRFGAFCNPKGRTICIFFIYLQNDTYYLVLASELLDKIRKRLHMYILRSDVQLLDSPDHSQVLGIQCPENSLSSLEFPDQKYAVKSAASLTTIRMPGRAGRFLLISATDNAIKLWTKLTTEENFTPADSTDWQYHDLSTGVVWLDRDSSEEYIPQMLNLDRINGISFNKGCYTGQEIVARTHYLGKAKRQMYFALCDSQKLPTVGMNIIDKTADTPVNIGKVVTAVSKDAQVALLLVMQSTDLENKILHLDNDDQDVISCTEISY